MGSSGMKVFLTGATGVLGQRLTRGLRQRGGEVVALARDPGSAREKKEAA